MAVHFFCVFYDFQTCVLSKAYARIESDVSELGQLFETMGISKKIRWYCISFTIFVAILLPANNALAQACPGCGYGCVNQITQNHTDKVRPEIIKHISNQFTEHRQWLVDDFFKDQVLPALMLFTEQMSVVAMQQTLAIGQFFDAKHQLETQRLLQELQSEAHKDYQPSEDFCYFGTNVRSLAASERKSKTSAYLMSRRQMARHLGQYNLGGAISREQDKAGRWEQFVEHFCDPQDNNWFERNTGLELACPTPPANPEYTNADIDYTRLIENARTISLNNAGSGFDLARGGLGLNPENRAVFALANNLYGHNVLIRDISKEKLQGKAYQQLYLALRSVAAKRSVAEHSFNAIVGLKSEGATSSASTDANTYEFLGAILTELGVSAGEVRNMIGTQPSYYAQLELLAKKIYQNPDFYANLYDKPANVKRKSVALKAIELMLDRAIYESQIRQEMATSVLLSARLREPFKEANRDLQAGQ